MAKQGYKKYSLFTSTVAQNNQPSGKDNGRPALNATPPDEVAPKSFDTINDSQEKLRNDENYSKDFSSLNDAGTLNTIYNTWLMHAANPYYRNNFGKNDINGRMNNKTYNATLNMQRLVDRYNNRERLMPGMANAGRYGVAAGNNEIVKNTPIETVDTRQYAQDLGVSTEQREKDLSRADLVASAIPNKFAKSKEAEVLVNQFLIQNEANINNYMRQLFADTQYKMPTETMLQEKLLKFGEDYKFFRDKTIYNMAIELSNNPVFMSLWTNIMAGVDGPDRFQILQDDAHNEMMKIIDQYTDNPIYRSLYYDLLNNAMAMNLLRLTKGNNMATAEELVTDISGKKGTWSDSQFAGGKQ